MAEAEALKLPKPVPPCEIRPELLNFNADRRWDLLAFVRPDEIEDVKAYTVDPNGNRYYLVHWKDSWKPESSLIYCEKLLQQFWERKSLIHQDTLYLSTTPTQSIEEHNVNKTNADILNELEQQVVAAAGGETTQEPTYPTSNLLLPPSFGSQEAKHETEDVVDGYTKTPMRHEEPEEFVDKPRDIDLVVTQVQEIIEEKSESLKDNLHKVPGLEEAIPISKNTLLKEDTLLNEDHDTETADVSIDDGDVALESTDASEEQKEFNEEDQKVAKEAEDINTSQSSSVVESPSKKGASKRKIRPPKQSMDTPSLKRTNKSKKAKTHENKKGPKISKTVNTIISSTSVSTNPDDGDNDTEPSPSEEVADASSKASDFKCMVCDKHLTTQQNLMKHLLTHNNNHTCQICMKTFKSTHFLKHHMDKHNPTYEYTCPICHKKFKFKNNMRGHLRKHNMEKKFECEICHKKFMGRYNLKEHMKAHSDNRPFECVFCRKTYKDKGALNKHLLTHQDKKVECEICKRQFTNANQVKRHMQFHFSWPGDSFKRKVSNKLGPDGEKTRHKCPYCDKVFNHYSNMNAHIHKKHKEKKIQCKQCSKLFAYQYELREHMFVHQNGGVESKFKCQVCDKYFQRSTTLKNHERTTHLGIKRFKCDICGKQFGTKFNMKVHIEKLHNKEDSDTEKPRRSRAAREKPRDDNNLVALAANDPTLLAPGNHPSGVTALGPPVSLTAPLLRNLSTSDIIRNAMTNIPELPYFPGLSARAYQFYGFPPPDFGVS